MCLSQHQKDYPCFGLPISCVIYANDNIHVALNPGNVLIITHYCAWYAQYAHVFIYSIVFLIDSPIKFK